MLAPVSWICEGNASDVAAFYKKIYFKDDDGHCFHVVNKVYLVAIYSMLSNVVTLLAYIMYS